MAQTWGAVAGIFLFLAGTGVGVGLGYFTLIVPRQGELRRNDQANPIVNGLKPQAQLEPLAPGRIRVVQDDMEHGGRSGSVRGRSWVVEATISPAEQGPFFDAWGNLVQGYLRQQACYPSGQSGQTRQATSGAGDAVLHARTDFEGKFRGTIHTWGIRKEEMLTLIVSITAR